MPNWCNNTTTLFHDNPKMLERVTAALEAEGLLQEFVEVGEGFVTITFLSAWSPPIEAYQKMEEQFGFRITSEYSEPGVGFRGTYKDGVEHTEDIPESDDEWIQW